MTSEKLAEAIRFCFRDSTFDAARTIAEKMHSEAGVQVAARSFHRHLPLQNMRCRILSDQPATFKYKSSGQEILLSSLATAVLVTHRKLNMSHLKMLVTSSSIELPPFPSLTTFAMRSLELTRILPCIATTRDQ